MSTWPWNSQNDVLQAVASLSWQVTALAKQLTAAVAELKKDINIMSQSVIDDITQKLNTLESNLEAAVTAIEAEIASLQGQGVDTSGLEAAAAKLSAEVDTVSGIAPAP